MFCTSHKQKKVRAMIIERDVENTLVRSVRKGGGLCLKFVSPGWAGAPDRVCLFPGGRVCFVELKRPGEKARPLQAHRAKQLMKLGFRVELIDSKKGVKGFMKDIQTDGGGIIQTDGGSKLQTDGGGVGDEP